MSIEAFVWNYRDGDVCPLSFDAVRSVFDTPGTLWDERHGCLTVNLPDDGDIADVFCGRDAASTGKVPGLLISRPPCGNEFLTCLFQLLQLDNTMLFYSDETTPVFHRSSDPSQYPVDLINELGVPRFADTPQDLLHQS